MSNAASAKSSKNASQREAIRFGSPELRRLVDDIGRSTATSVREEVNPLAAIDLVRRSGLGAVRVPRDDGGSGWSVREFVSMFIDLAEADRVYSPCGYCIQPAPDIEASTCICCRHKKTA